MFAAAAIVLQTIARHALAVAIWVAQKTLILYIAFLVLPWVVRNGVLYYADYLSNLNDGNMNAIDQMIAEVIEKVAPAADIPDIALTSVGGYLAYHCGLVEYFSIIMTALGVSWYAYIMKSIIGVTTRAVTVG